MFLSKSKYSNIKLEKSLNYALAISLFIIFTLYWMAANRSMHYLIEDILSSRFQADSISIIRGLMREGTGDKKPCKDFMGVYSEQESGYYYKVIINNNKKILSESLKGSDIKINEDIKMGEAKSFWNIHGPKGERLFVWAWRIEIKGNDIKILMAHDLTEIQEYRMTVKLILLFLSFSGIIALILIQRKILRRAFRKLDKIRHSLKDLQSGNISYLEERYIPEEVSILVNMFNRILYTLESRLGRSRNALGNLAHALKTPLNLLFQDLRTLEGELRGKHQKVVGETLEHAERIQKLIDRELLRARIAGQGGGGRPFYPEREMSDLLSALRQVHRDKKVEIICEIPDEIPPFGDREDILELLGNILDNAFKWSRQKISCRISHEDGWIHIRIEDDGPGLESDKIHELATRGKRMDESVEGTGLGLAISQDIVRLQGGSIHFSRSKDLGGMSVHVRLPINRL